MFELKTTREVAEHLAIREWEIENALRRREVARPRVVGGVRLWTAESIDQLRKALTARGRLTAAANGA